MIFQIEKARGFESIRYRDAYQMLVCWGTGQIGVEIDQLVFSSQQMITQEIPNG